MECINHPGTAAAGTCQMCGKALCAPCMNRFDPPVCEPCLITHNGALVRRLYLDLAVTAIIFAGVAAFVAFNVQTNREGGIIVGLMLAGAYWGWQFLSKIPMPVILTTGAGLIFYFFLKFSLAVLAGFIIAPWQIFKRVKKIRAISKLEKEIKAGQA